MVFFRDRWLENSTWKLCRQTESILLVSDWNFKSLEPKSREPESGYQTIWFYGNQTNGKRNLVTSGYSLLLKLIPRFLKRNGIFEQSKIDHLWHRSEIRIWNADLIFRNDNFEFNEFRIQWIKTIKWIEIWIHMVHMISLSAIVAEPQLLQFVEFGEHSKQHKNRLAYRPLLPSGRSGSTL